MIYEEERIRERIHQLIHRLGMTPRAFCIKIGSQPSNIYKILSGERGLPKGFPAAILKAFPDVRKDWLLFGEGQMCVGDEPMTNHPTDTKPRLPRRMDGGHLTDYYMGDKRGLCQEKPLITQFSDYDFTIILKNDRMWPIYRPGDELAFKKTTIIEWGNDYLLDTAEGPKFKKIKDGGQAVICESYNKELYPNFEVPKHMIYGYYKLVGVIRVL